jgi:hypothetical protein
VPVRERTFGIVDFGVSGPSLLMVATAFFTIATASSLVAWQ